MYTTNGPQMQMQKEWQWVVSVAAVYFRDGAFAADLYVTCMIACATDEGAKNFGQLFYLVIGTALLLGLWIRWAACLQFIAHVIPSYICCIA